MSVQVIYKKETKSINKGVFAIFTDENFKIFKNKKILSTNELEFLRLNLEFGHKCRKSFLNYKGYIVGSENYKKCVLNRGKIDG